MYPLTPERRGRNHVLPVAMSVICALAATGVGGLLASGVPQKWITGIANAETPTHCDTLSGLANSSPAVYASALAGATVCAYEVAKKNGRGETERSQDGSTIVITTNDQETGSSVTLAATAGSTQPGPGRSVLPNPANVTNAYVQWAEPGGGTAIASFALGGDGTWHVYAVGSGDSGTQNTTTIDEGPTGLSSFQSQLKETDSNEMIGSSITDNSSEVQRAFRNEASTVSKAADGATGKIVPLAQVVLALANRDIIQPVAAA